MPNFDLFESRAEDAIISLLREAKAQAKQRQFNEFGLAIDYLEGRMIEDVRSEINQRYEKTQMGAAGQRIQPVIIPLVQRYIAEAATAYNKPVKRKLLTLDGKENTEATEILHAFLEDSGYNETMHKLDQSCLLLKSCGLWYQLKRGKIRPVITYPHLINPVVPGTPVNFDQADQEDYVGYSVNVVYTAEQVSRVQPVTWCLITPAQQIYYEARYPFEPERILSTHENPFTWPQTIDTEDMRGSLVSDAPLQMLTIWHREKAVDELLCDTDPEIVYLNRELNVQWSVLLDTMRVQGWSQMVLSLLNPEAPPKAISYGSRFALPLGPQESVQMVSSANDYTSLVTTLQNFVKLIAVCKRQSSTDFALDQTGPESGFAKLVASLPKIEARQERISRLKKTEENIAWPRIGAMLKYMGKIQDPTKLKMQVEFSDIEFPRTVQEETQQQEHDFKYGLSTPAIVLAKRMGITEEQAQELIDKRKEKMPKEPQPGEQGNGGTMRSRFGNLIRQPKVETKTP